jgi:hypothetical protein
MKNIQIKNKQGGFLELIIVIIIGLLLMQYYGITFTSIFDWLSNLVQSVW